MALLLVIAITSDSMAAGAGLWVPNTGTVAEFQGALKSGTAKAHRVFSSDVLDGCSTIAFDRSGNMWVTNFNTSTIAEFTSAQTKKMKKTPAQDPVVIISQDPAGHLDGPEGITFDSSGNMWVGSEDGHEILMYTPAQYASSGNPTPNVILNGNSFNFTSPSTQIFDNAGNMWVVDEEIPNGNGGNGEVFKYTKAQITGLTPGTHNIDPVFGMGWSEFVHLEGMTFDRSGNMWLADELAVNVYKFSASQLTGSGLSNDIAPVVMLDPTAMSGPCPKSLDSPYGVAIDSAGNLYVSNDNVSGQCSGSLAKFLAKSITTSGSPVPKVFITSDGNGIDIPNYLTFGPKAK